jgi:hypothetical protein
MGVSVIPDMVVAVINSRCMKPSSLIARNGMSDRQCASIAKHDVYYYQQRIFAGIGYVNR